MSFNVYDYLHRKSIQQDATLHSLFISGNCSTCFGWYFHPSSGAHTTVSTASLICHSVTAICRYRGRAGTGLSVLWVAYATHSTFKPVPTLPQFTDAPDVHAVRLQCIKSTMWELFNNISNKNVKFRVSI
jgi:hypothetical protein